MSTKKIIVVNETVMQSLAKDSITFLMVAGLCSVGYILGITAMEWVGGLMAILAIFSRGMRELEKSSMTVDEALALLNEMKETGAE